MGRGRLCGVLAASALLWAACGLPDPFYLSPPAVTTTGTLVYSFQLTSTDRSAEPDFRGFELYYKIYADPGSAAADAGWGGGDPGPSLLIQKGFLAVCRGPSVQPAPPGGLSADTSADARILPLIPIAPGDRSSSFPVQINFGPVTGDTSTNFSYTSPSTGQPVVQQIDRHVNVSAGSGCKPFTFGAANYVSTDPDISAVFSNIQGGIIYVGVYVLSYGIQNLSTPIYSSPVFMGYLQLSQFSP